MIPRLLSCKSQIDASAWLAYMHLEPTSLLQVAFRAGAHSTGEVEGTNLAAIGIRAKPGQEGVSNLIKSVCVTVLHRQRCTASQYQSQSVPILRNLRRAA
jgi:hypothetical protein